MEEATYGKDNPLDLGENLAFRPVRNQHNSGWWMIYCSVHEFLFLFHHQITPPKFNIAPEN